MTTWRFHDLLMIMFAWIFPDRFLQLHAAIGVGARGKTHTQAWAKRQNCQVNTMKTGWWFD